MRPPTQVLIDLMDKLTALLTAMVSPANKDEHDTEVARVREEIAQAKEALVAELSPHAPMPPPRHAHLYSQG